MSVYKTIKFLRNFHGWSQEEISCKLNISQNGYGCIERGDTNISLSRLEEIANLFNMSLLELIQFSEKKMLNNEKEIIEKDINIISFQKSEEKNFTQYLNLQKNHEIQSLLFEGKQKEVDLLRKINQLLENKNKVKSKSSSSYFLLDNSFTNGAILKELEKKIIISKNENTLFSMYLIGFNTKKSLCQQLSIEEANELISEIKLRINLLIPNTQIFTEFGHLQLIFLSDLYLREDVIGIAQKVLVSLAYPFRMSYDEYITINSNIGITIYHQDIVEAEVLRKNTYIAFNHSCKKSIDSYSIFSSELYKEIINEEKIYDNLWNAIEYRNFEIFYQPQVRLNTDEIVSIEALFRVPCGKNYTLPVIMLSVIRNTHLIISVGEYVLREVCRQGKEWIQLGLINVKMAVNISVIQFKYSDIFELVKQVTEEFDFPPNLLEIEIRDFSEIENNNYFIDIFNNLSQLGVSIVFDDFHLQPSSLKCLDFIPVEKVKINSHILTKSQSDSSQEILQFMVLFLKKKNKNITYVGVETKSELNFLKSTDIDYFQGFLNTEPLCSKDMQVFLNLPNL